MRFHLAIPIAILSSSVSAHAELIRLSPQLPHVAVHGVARLNIARNAIADADVADHGMKLIPAEAHDWLGASGQPFEVRISATSPDGGQAVLTVWDWQLRPALTRRWNVPHSETLSFEVAGRGTYMLTLDRQKDGKTVSRLVRSFSVCPSNAGRRRAWWGNGQFFLGTCAYPERMHWRNAHGARFPADMTMDEARGKEAGLAGRLGLQVIRLTALEEWPVNLYEKHGLRALLKVGQAPKLGTQLLAKYEGVKDARWRYPMPESICRPHYADVARRLGKRAVFFEINNETDNDDFWRGTAEEFIANATWAAEELKRHAPDAPVCVAGWTFMKPATTRRYVTAFRDLFPWSSIHVHGNFVRCVERLARYEALLREAGADTKPRVQTEMGFCHWRLDMDAASAGYAMRKIVYHWAKGYRGVITYRLRDQGGPRLGGDTKGLWGMLDHDFCPRFKYGLLAALIDKFAGYRFDHALASGPDLYVYVFAHDTRRLVVAFAPNIAWRPKHIGTLRTDARRAVRIDAMGNEETIVDPATIRFASGFYPDVLRLEGGSPIEVPRSSSAQ